MSPWIVNFKVGTVIQTPNESVLLQLECGALALAVKAGLGTKQLERLDEFILPERLLGTGGASPTTDFEFHQPELTWQDSVARCTMEHHGGACSGREPS